VYYEDAHVKLYNKDCRSKDELPDESVQCVVTSPPYWGLRKYSGEQGLIWGDNQCQHEWVYTGIPKSGGVGDYEVGRVGNAKARSGSHEAKDSNTCQLCGAWKGAYGLEPTPEMYVQHTVEILREVRRVLRKDGVVFWNIGDSYNGSGGEHKHDKGQSGLTNNRDKVGFVPGRNVSSLKPKDLCLIPQRLAIAAQEDGWWVRSVIIWSKPNPMPESVTDRPTESHEYILMLTKSARYYWDQDAVREPHTWIENRPSGMVRQAEQYRDRVKHNDPKYGGGGSGFQGHSGGMKANGTPLNNPNGRNIRSVWTFPTQPYPEAHFAVFPEKLPELCIKAATPEVGCCPDCGTPWERVTERENMKIRRTDWNEQSGNRTGSAGTMIEPARAKTLHWQPTCKCNPDWKESKVYPTVPSLVLDPFAGAGTTLWVAKKLNRRAVGYELSEEYCRLTVDRLRQQVML